MYIFETFCSPETVIVLCAVPFVPRKILFPVLGSRNLSQLRKVVGSEIATLNAFKMSAQKSSPALQESGQRLL